MYAAHPLDRGTWAGRRVHGAGRGWPLIGSTQGYGVAPTAVCVHMTVLLTFVMYTNS